MSQLFMERGEEMKKLIAPTLMLLGILAIIAITTLEGNNNTLEATNNSLESRVLALEEEIALHLEELKVHEEHIRALEWRDPDQIIRVVSLRLGEQASSCNNQDYNCYFDDPMLYAFYDIPTHERADYVYYLTTQGTWTAEQSSNTIWYVTVTDPEGYYYTFVADSTYHTICWDQSLGCSTHPRVQ
jgi:hypothetical protein